MFVAWPLYVMHAVLTGTSLALVNALDIKDGFGFSAGLFDYLLNFEHRRPSRGLLIPIGLGYAVVYYFLLPVRDPEVEPAHTRSRGRGRGVTRRSRHERLSMLISAGRVVTPARVFAPGWVLVEGDRIADVSSGAPPRTARRRPRRRPRSCPGSSTPTSTAAVARRSTRASRRTRPRSARAHLAHGTTTMHGQPGHRRPADHDPVAARARRARRRRRARRAAPRGAVAEPASHAGAHDPGLADRARRTRRSTPSSTPAAGTSGWSRWPRAARRAGRDPAADRGRGGRGDRPHRRDVRRRPGRAGRRRDGRHPPVQRDARGCTTASRARSRRCSSTPTPTSS